jgi:hypothetical protein
MRQILFRKTRRKTESQKSERKPEESQKKIKNTEKRLTKYNPSAVLATVLTTYRIPINPNPPVFHP